MPRIPRDQLAAHSCDTETYLFGIGSTNLVQQKPEFIPEITKVKSLNIYERSSVIMPQPNLFNGDNERPLIYQ